MVGAHTLEVPIRGMDCAECTQHVRKAIAGLSGVESVEVLLSTEKAIVRLDPDRVDLGHIRKAVEGAGYSVPDRIEEPIAGRQAGEDIARQVLRLLGVVVGVVLFVVVVGEWAGLYGAATRRLPWPLWVAGILAGGYPVFRNVARAVLQRRVTSHTLMTVGVLAAVAAGEWAVAAVVVFFMRLGDYAERFTTERARQAVRDLSRMAPQTARLEREGEEREVPVGDVRVGNVVIVRPGEQIPVDGQVISGHATVDQAAITGESMPVEAGPGTGVYAASIARLGSLRVRATRVGQDTTFGRVIKLVEEAEAHRADVQRTADRFSTYYLPVIAGVAVLTYLIRRDPLSTAAVLVVACSCSFALATPIAMLASIGAAARRGLLIKGGKYLESLARSDVLLIDKTGTLTLGRPQITDVVPLDAVNEVNENELVALAASVERYSEHPLAEAVRAAARARTLTAVEPEQFESLPGRGVRARVDGKTIAVGSYRLLADGSSVPAPAAGLESQGKTLLFVVQDGRPLGILAAADTVRDEVPRALQAVRALGVSRIELLTGDNAPTAKALADTLGIPYRAELLPEDKIAIVKEYQAKGQTVVMVGDGVNDAPALAQADVGIAMGAAGSDIAVEAAHAALMRDDWMLVPELFLIARRTMRVVALNIGFTTGYNLIGVSLAAFGYLPLIFAAAAQSLPDFGILFNSARLLRQK